MKKLAIIISILSFFLFGCGEKTETDNDEVSDNCASDEEVLDDDVDYGSDEDQNIVEVSDGCHGDPIFGDWMQPEDAWTSWAYLKMMGPIGDYNGEYAPAVFTDGKIKLSSGTTDFSDGSYMNYDNQIIIADAAAYEFIDVDETAGTAVIDYWHILYQLNLQLVPLMVEEGATDVGFGATVIFRHTFIDVKFDASGAVTTQQVRKNCYLAISKTEEIEQEGETYDVPIGDMFGCFGDNTDGSVGEDLKMMFKNEMDEDNTSLLEFFNTQSDGSVLEYGNEGYEHLCQCFDADGNEVNCWEYDGPGGAEECPDYVPQEDCKLQGNDEDVVIDEDVVPDEDAA